MIIGIAIGLPFMCPHGLESPSWVSIYRAGKQPEYGEMRQVRIIQGPGQWAKEVGGKARKVHPKYHPEQCPKLLDVFLRSACTR